MLISLAYRLTRKLLGALTTGAQRDVSKDAEVLVLRHENALLRGHVEKVRYEPVLVVAQDAAQARQIPDECAVEQFAAASADSAAPPCRSGGSNATRIHPGCWRRAPSPVAVAPVGCA